MSVKKCRLKRARRVKMDLGGTIRPASSKCNLEKLPGMHGDRRGRPSNYGDMLLEKQKARYMYGLSEKQFKRTFTEGRRRKGSTGDNLVLLLERRLDNTVFRMGFAATRAEARQLVSHRAILVNGKICNIPSCELTKDDVVEVREKSKTQLRIKAALQIAEQNGFPEWVVIDQKKVSGTLKRYPERDEMNLDINLNLIVEYYSR